MEFVYRYRIIGRGKDILEGAITAPSAADARAFFENQQFYVESLSFDLFSTLKLFIGKEGFNDSEIENFCFNLNEMLSMGASPRDTLRELSGASNSLIVSSATRRAQYFVASVGKSLPEALKAAGFPEQLVSVIDIGLRSSNLEALLKDYVNFASWGASVKRTIKKAAAYPLFLITVAYVFTLLQSFFIFPKLKEMFMTAGTSDLPVLTKLMLKLSNFANYGALGIVIAIIAFTVAFFIIMSVLGYALKKTFTYAPPDSWLGRTAPAIFIRAIILSLFINGMRFSIRSGMPYQKALELGREGLLVKDAPIANIIGDAIKEAKMGKSFSYTLKKMLQYEPYARPLLAGIERRDISTALDKLSRALMNRIERQTEPVIAAIKYVSLFIVGAIIGLTLFASYFPIYQQMMKVY